MVNNSSMEKERLARYTSDYARTAQLLYAVAEQGNSRRAATRLGGRILCHPKTAVLN